MGTLYGYARGSSAQQVASVPRQVELIRAKMEQLAAVGKGRPGTIYEETASADKIAYNERPVFARKVLPVVSRGDTLIVWQLSRIDRDPFRMLEAVRYFVQRDASLVVLDMGGVEIDLSTPMGRAILMMSAIFLDMDRENRRQSIKSGHAHAKALGQNARWAIPHGMRPVYRKVKGKGVRRCAEWDEQECKLLCELVQRHDGGEYFSSIAQDWHARGLTRKATGKLWCPIQGHNGKPAIQMIFKAYHNSKKILAEQGSIGGQVPGTGLWKPSPEED